MKALVLALLAAGLAGCGAREGLTLPKGAAAPPPAYGASEPPGAGKLLTPPIQTRPARSDDLIESSEERRSDEFDLPPPN